MKILFSTFGSLGDLHPYIALALESQARGHEPILATVPKYRAKIENLGLGFRPIRPDFPPEDEFVALVQKVMDNRHGPEYLFKHLLAPALRQNYADLLEAARDADVVITHPAALGGPLASAKLGKKWLSSVLAPISTWSIYDPPVPPAFSQFDRLRVLGPLWGRLLKALAHVATRNWVPEIEQLRIEADIPLRGHPIYEGQYSPYGTLALFSPHFAAPQRDWPTHTVATGFCFYDTQGYEAMPKGTLGHATNWREWIAAGEAPVVFTLGSSAVFNAGEFLAASRTLVREFKVRAIYLTGGVATFDAPLEANELALDYAPFSELFPSAKFVVHQGGIGTTSQALRAGVPQLVVPHAHDQPDNAGRLKRLGVGYTADLAPYKRGRVEGAFRFMLDNFDTLSRQAQALSAKIRTENGPRTACEAIEQLF